MAMTLEDVKALPRAFNYSLMVQNLFKDMGTRSDSAIHGVLGVLGELGELIPAVIRKDFDNIVEESGDTFFYMQGIMGLFGWSLNELLLDPPKLEEDLVVAFIDNPLSGTIHYAANVADALKKEWAYGKELSEQKVKENLAKMLVCFSAFIVNNGLNYTDIMAHNQYKLVTGPNARYKSGSYSDAAAIARADKAPGE